MYRQAPGQHAVLHLIPTVCSAFSLHSISSSIPGCRDFRTVCTCTNPVDLSAADGVGPGVSGACVSVGEKLERP